MAGSLVLIQETTVSSAVASVTLTGIDSTYDVYKVVFNNVLPDTDTQTLSARPTISGTMDSGGNKDFAYKITNFGRARVVPTPNKEPILKIKFGTF